MDQIKYSVVMPVYCMTDEHREVVFQARKSIIENSTNFEFILVDDGSPKSPIHFKDSEYNPTTLIRHKKNMGIASSWNDGIRIARGYYIAVVNDDITVEEGWLEALESAVNWPNAMVSAPGVKGKENYHGIEENYQWYPGYCFMITQDVVSNIGLFDEQFNPFNYEDWDYWTRCLKEDGLLMRNYSTMITHKEGDVLHKLEYDKVDAINKEKFIKKHGFDPTPVFCFNKEFDFSKL